jgi:hypothetical protein
VYPVACDNFESDTEDKPPVNNYNIHVHAGAEVDNNAVSKIIKGIQNIGKHM